MKQWTLIMVTFFVTMLLMLNAFSAEAQTNDPLALGMTVTFVSTPSNNTRAFVIEIANTTKAFDSFRFDTGNFNVLRSNHSIPACNATIYDGESFPIDFPSFESYVLTTNFTTPLPENTSFAIYCPDVYFDFNDHLNTTLPFVVNVLNEQYDFIYATLPPVNDDVSPDPDPEPDQDAVAEDVAVELFVRFDQQHDQIANTRDFFLHITNTTRDFTTTFHLLSEKNNTISLITPAPAPGNMACKVDGTSDTVPVQWDEEKNGIAFEFQHFQPAANSTFSLDCRHVFFIDFSSIKNETLSLAFGIAAETGSIVPLVAGPVNDDPEPIDQGPFASMEINLLPLDDLEPSSFLVLEDDSTFSFVAKNITTNKRQFAVHAVNATQSYSSGQQFFLEVGREIVAVWPEIAANCTANGLAAETTVISSTKLSFIVPSAIEESNNLVFQCFENSVYFNFTQFTGNYIDVFLYASNDTEHRTMAEVEPVWDDEDHEVTPPFSSFSFQLASYPTESNPIPNTRSFTIQAFSAVDSYAPGREFAVNVTGIFELENQAEMDCLVNSRPASAQFSQDTITFTVPPGPNITLGGDMIVSCDHVYLNFSNYIGLVVNATLSLSESSEDYNTTHLGPIDDEDIVTSAPFDALNVELSEYPDQTNPIKNTRSFKVVAEGATREYAVGESFIIVTQKPLFAQQQDKLINCFFGTTPMTTAFNGTNIMITTPLVIPQGQELTFTCQAGSLFMDFRQAINQSLSITIATIGDSDLVTSFSLPPVNDEDVPPVVTKLFADFKVNLQPRRDEHGELIKFVRDFILIGTTTQLDINMDLEVSTPQALFVVEQNANIVCSWGEDHTAVPTNVTSTGFKLNFTAHPVAKDTAHVQIVCSHLHLDFTAFPGASISLKIQTDLEPYKVNVALLPEVDDREKTVLWPMSLSLPLHTKYQPFVTLNIDGVPSFTQTQTNELWFNFALGGLTTSNSTLHSLTVTSYPTKDSTEPVRSIVPLNFNEAGTMTALKVTFPPNHVKLSLSVQIATTSTAEVVQVLDLSLKSLSNNRVYQPDYHLTEYKWEKYTPEAFPADAKHPIKMAFSAYVGDKKNPQQYGPSFSIIFPKTGVALSGTSMTLRTNSSIPLTQTTPAFFFTGSKVKASMLMASLPTANKEACHIPEFKIDVPVIHDQYSQQLTFDFTGIKQLEKEGAEFTLQCQNHLIIAANVSQLNRPIAFSIEGQGADGKATVPYATSWIVAPPSDKKKGGHGFLIFVLVLFVILIIVGGAYVAKKKGLIGGNNSSGKAQEPLLGDYNDDNSITIQ